MPPPMQSNAFNDLQTKVAYTYKDVADQSMISAADELRKDQLKNSYTDTAIADVTVSGDGSWLKRGYSSQNGRLNGFSLFD